MTSLDPFAPPAAEPPVHEPWGRLALTVLALAVYLAHYTRFGRTVYAIGGSEQSAMLMGLPFMGAEGAILLGMDEREFPARSALRKIGALIVAAERDRQGEAR